MNISREMVKRIVNGTLTVADWKALRAEAERPYYEQILSEKRQQEINRRSGIIEDAINALKKATKKNTVMAEEIIAMSPNLKYEPINTVHLWLKQSGYMPEYVVGNRNGRKAIILLYHI